MIIAAMRSKPLRLEGGHGAGELLGIYLVVRPGDARQPAIRQGTRIEAELSKGW